MNVSLFCIMLALSLLYIVLIMMLCLFYLSFQYFDMERMLNPMIFVYQFLRYIYFCWFVCDSCGITLHLVSSYGAIVTKIPCCWKKINSKNKTKQKQKWKPIGNNGIPRHKPPNSTACHWSRYLSCYAISFSPCFLVAMNLAVTWNYMRNQLLSPISCFDNGNLLQQHK